MCRCPAIPCRPARSGAAHHPSRLELPNRADHGDRGGDTMVALKADGAGPHTMENARRKAYAARTFRMSTQQFIDDMKTRPARREQTTLPSVIGRASCRERV